uniref:Folylpolyglutamate synthase n=1 Tax=Ciona savignyi TaxID=51511 RepID=H2YQE8_CIOSA
FVYHRQRATRDMKYNDAVKVLNELQGYEMLSPQQKKDATGLGIMKDLLRRVKVTNEDLNKMKVIHITGTKGKGSTCAFVENILKQHGVKTGFCSSPHLLEVRERIRVNGRPISTELFAKYFWKVYNLLNEQKCEIQIPNYYYMLTLLAFYSFKHERVNAAILEVNIGGAYDCTNVITKPVCCGVSTLDIDHTDLLGNTLAEIAWHKGGIFKPGAALFTVPQPDEGMKVLIQRADEAGEHLKVVPQLDLYPIGKEIQLGLAGDHQKANASLAVQLANSWLERTSNKRMASQNMLFPINEKFSEGLRTCSWDGRCQVIKFQGVTFYLDGAHTVKSLNCVTEWFNEQSAKEQSELGSSCEKVLAFNVLSERDVKVFLSVLFSCGFDSNIFLPSFASSSCVIYADQISLKYPIEHQVYKAFQNRDIWKEICISQQQPTTDEKSPVFLSVADAVSTKYQEKHLQVLVTGSLRLVGAFLAILK